MPGVWRTAGGLAERARGELPPRVHPAPVAGLIWAVFTAFIYWDVALSSSALSAVTTIETKLADQMSAEHNFVLSDANCEAAFGPDFRDNPLIVQVKGTAAGKPASQTSDKSNGMSDSSGRNDMLKACGTFGDLELRLAAARTDLAAVTETRLWKNAVSWFMYLYTAHHRLRGDVSHPREGQLAVVISVFTHYIVPMMFGVLGTIAGVIRTIWNRIGANTLCPLDRRLWVASVPLGVVASLSIGLILTPSTSPVQGVTNVAASVTLSASALAFLAGYGADAFFAMIDELLRRVFALSR